MDFAALRAELDAGHPTTGAYNADAQLAADQLNAVNQTINRDSMSGDEVFDATDSAQWGALSDANKQLWMAFCGRAIIDPFGSANVAFVTSILSGQTVTNLSGLRVQSVSRATELGLGRIRAGDVTEARK